MVSFDVKSLFTKVPVDDTLEIINNYLENNDLELPVDNNIFMGLLKLCLKYNYFGFDNEFYN